jgi:transglutaminase-like putative cysteine protease
MNTREPGQEFELEQESPTQKKGGKPRLKAEDSVELRVVAACIAAWSIIIAATYTHMPLLLGLLYFWLTITGSYLSYYFRDKRVRWLPILIGIGLIGVMIKFVFEIYVEFKVGRLEGLIPFIHVLCGLLTLQTFDLESRTDLNISVLIALGLFTCTAVIGTDLKFGFFVLVMVVLGTLMLYFESISRTKSNEQKPREGSQAPVYTATARAISGASVLPILSIPALSFLFFMIIPRVDSVFDTIVNYVHSKTGNSAPRLSYLPGGDNIHFDDKVKGKAGTEGDGTSLPGSVGGGGHGPSSSGSKGGKGAAKDAGGGNGAGTTSGGGSDGKTGKGDTKSGGGGTASGAGGAKGAKGDGAGKGGGGSKKDDKEDKFKPAIPGSDADDSSSESSDDAQDSDEMVLRDAANSVNDNKLLLYVRSNETVYLRRMYFDNYDGHHWTVSHHSKEEKCERLQGEYVELGGVPALHVSQSMNTKEMVQRISIMDSIGHVLPTANIPQSVAIGNERISVDDFGVLRCENPLKEITNYEVVSKIPVFDLDKLRHAPTPESASADKQLAQYLQLPEKLPTEIEAEAQTIANAGGDANWFGKAERLCNHLRSHYKYSTAPYVDNPKEDMVSDFLFKKKEGACGQFAASMAVMCRSIGIPSRIVGGFAPGEYDSQTDRREVRAKDGHSWVEVYIPEVGWVPFDGTPGGTLPVPPDGVNPVFATFDKTFKDIAAVFNAQQLDRQLTKGRDENFPIKNDDTKVHGLQSGIRDVTRPGTDLTKAGNSAGSWSPLGSPGQSPKDTTPDLSKDQKPDGKKNDKKQPILLFVSIGAGILLLVALGAVAYVFRAHLRRFIFRSEYPRVAKGVKPSTLVFLKLSDDLRKLKILRRPSDTVEDLEKRFFENFTDDEPCHPELPSLFTEFLELYQEDRFSTAENSVENYRVLRDLGARIHLLARTKYVVDKAS